MNDEPWTIAPVTEEDLDALRPVWLALHRHHRDIVPLPLQVDEAESWQARRATYLRLLRTGEGFLLAAWRGAEAEGYAAVELHDGPDDTIPTGPGERWAEILTLGVRPERRGAGVGSRLLDAVDARLVEWPVTVVVIAAMVENAGALRLYERRGFAPRETVLWRVGGPGGAPARTPPRPADG